MIVASIDIGTNTVLLLIAKVDVVTKSIIPIFNSYKMPRIGRGIKQSGKINADSISRLFTVLSELKTIIYKFNCDTILLSGTNAFRIASNAEELIELIKNELGFDVDVISGEEEAEFAYLGATSGLKDKTLVSVIDIGGSSTEMITGIGTKIISQTSLQIGSVTLTEEYLKILPPEKSVMDKLKEEIKLHFKQFGKNLIADKIIAVAGTATTIACMKLGLKEFDECFLENFTLNITDLKDLISKISQLSATEILKSYGAIMKGREDIILAGAIILEQLMKFYEVNSVIVSTRGIRYGAIVKRHFKDTMDSNFV